MKAMRNSVFQILATLFLLTFWCAVTQIYWDVTIGYNDPYIEYQEYWLTMHENLLALALPVAALCAVLLGVLLHQMKKRGERVRLSLRPWLYTAGLYGALHLISLIPAFQQQGYSEYCDVLRLVPEYLYEITLTGSLLAGSVWFLFHDAKPLFLRLAAWSKRHPRLALILFTFLFVSAELLLLNIERYYLDLYGRVYYANNRPRRFALTQEDIGRFISQFQTLLTVEAGLMLAAACAYRTAVARVYRNTKTNRWLPVWGMVPALLAQLTVISLHWGGQDWSVIRDKWILPICDFFPENMLLAMTLGILSVRRAFPSLWHGPWPRWRFHLERVGAKEKKDT